MQNEEIGEFEGLKVYLGITDAQVEQLINYTKADPEVQRFTTDLKRFPTKEAFNTWKEGRTLYSLADSQGNLLGFIWIRPKQIAIEVQADGFDPSDYGITIAVRLYNGARDKGYSKPFMQIALDHYKKSPEFQNADNKGIWIITASDNIPGQKSFLRFGFKEIKNKLESDKILMVLV